MRLRPAHVLAPGGAVGWCGVADFHRGTEKGEEPEVLAAVRAVRQGRPAGFRPKPRWVFFSFSRIQIKSSNSNLNYFKNLKELTKTSLVL